MNLPVRLPAEGKPDAREVVQPAPTSLLMDAHIKRRLVDLPAQPILCREPSHAPNPERCRRCIAAMPSGTSSSWFSRARSRSSMTAARRSCCWACARGSPAGTAHHPVNHSGDNVSYPRDDLVAVRFDAGWLSTREDGQPCWLSIHGISVSARPNASAPAIAGLFRVRLGRGAAGITASGRQPPYGAIGRRRVDRGMVCLRHSSLHGGCRIPSAEGASSEAAL